jgi:hypothetical protein
MRAMILAEQRPVEQSPLALADIAEPHAEPGEVRVRGERLRGMPD